MPRDIKGIKIFIGSAGGLDSLRDEFRRIIDEYNRLEALPLQVLFEPVGWEHTLPTGSKRGQAVINDELHQCDYALFLLRDRWGTPPDTAASGSPYTSGTEEEFAVAGECITAKTMRDRAALFLPVAAAQMKDPGAQLSAVLKFRQALIDQKGCLFKQLNRDEDFAGELRALLAQWRRAHEPRGTSRDDERGMLASLSLGTLNRSEEEIAVYDEVIARYGAAVEPALREQVARSMVNKGIRFGALNRSEDAVRVYDEVVALYGAAPELALHEQVARAKAAKATLRRASRKPRK
jgi:Domain of unknown function (DUF4062)